MGARRDLFDFYDLKGIVAILIERFGLSDKISYAPLSDDERLHPGRAATILLETGEDMSPSDTGKPRKAKITTISKPVGVIGELHPAVRERLEINLPRAVVAEIDLDALIAAAGPATFRSISRYPATIQDLSIVAPVAVPEAQVAALIRRGAGDLLENLTLFDVYSGAQVGEGRRSLTYHLTFRAADRTLTDEALAKVRKKIIGGLEREIDATIRS